MQNIFGEIAEVKCTIELKFDCNINSDISMAAESIQSNVYSIEQVFLALPTPKKIIVIRSPEKGKLEEREFLEREMMRPAIGNAPCIHSRYAAFQGEPHHAHSWHRHR